MQYREYVANADVRSGWLPLDGQHTMYFEESGHPRGRPVVYLHGGPGAGMEPSIRRLHDPQAYRLVMFDQRGCGRSTPAGELRDNTTQHLVADIERLREHLGIGRWIVSGGSWGSTLALAYAQAHPRRCEALVLRGIWLGSVPEMQWFQGGLRNFYPDVWEQTVGPLAPREADGYFERLRDRILDPDPAVAGPAAVLQSRYEWLSCSANPSAEDLAAIDAELAPGYCIPYQRVSAHYWRHRYFLAPNQLLDSVPAIRHVPGFIVNGRLDVVCPPVTAFELKKAWPQAQLELVPQAGHFSTEPGIAAALLRIMESLK
ncbi:MAG: prolyl aminopeptidase [Burkholderiaceae bacterium]|jgi:proline iminopeptidase|nr:prolyl aminopeptidase [Burkholderiaceae bacterium]